MLNEAEEATEQVIKDIFPLNKIPSIPFQLKSSAESAVSPDLLGVVFPVTSNIPTFVGEVVVSGLLSVSTPPPAGSCEQIHGSVNVPICMYIR